MNFHKKVIISYFFLICIFSTSAFSFSDWKAFKTDHFTVYYKPAMRNKAVKVINSLEFYREKTEKLTGNSRKGTIIVLEDAGAVSNGYTDIINDRIHLYQFAPSGGDLAYSIDWLSSVGVHEYTHMLTNTNAGGLPKDLVSVFGNIFYPNAILPSWAMEGIAVYSESNTLPFSGRLNAGYFGAYLGTRVGESRFPSLLDASFSPFEYPLSMAPYIYGSGFFDYLSKKYGETKFSEFFSEYGKDIPIIDIDLATKRIFGKTFPQLWKDWQDQEEGAAAGTVIDGEKVTDKGWKIESPVISGGKLFFSHVYPVKTGVFKIYWLNDIFEKDLKSGEERVVVSSSISGGGDFVRSVGSDIKIKNNKLYYLESYTRPGYDNASLAGQGLSYILHEKDLLSGKDKALFNDDIRDFEIIDNGNILYSKDIKNGEGSKLILYDKDRAEMKEVLSSAYLIGHISEEKGRIIVSAKKEFENFSVYELDLDRGELKPLVHSPYYEGEAKIVGDKVYFSANYGGKMRIYAYDLAKQKIFSVVNGDYATGPCIDENNGDIYFIGLNSKGMNIYKKKEQPVEFDIPQNYFPVPPDFAYEEKDLKEGGYAENMTRLLPNLRLPFFYADSSGSIAGLYLRGSDAIGDISYLGIFAQDFSKNRVKTKFSLKTSYLAPVSASITYSDEDLKRVDVDLSLPIISRSSVGLDRIDMGLSASDFDDFTRKQLGPYFALGFGFPRTYLTASLWILAERKSWGSTLDRTGIYSLAGIKHLFWSNEIDLLAFGIHDPQNTSTVFPVIRGYQAALTDKKGAVVSASVSRILLSVRRGGVYDSFYIDDISGSLFTDNAFADSGVSQNSYGGEIHLEFKAFFNADFGLGYAVNKEKSGTAYFLTKLFLPY